MIQERRKFKRSDIFLIVNFRHLRDNHEHTLGIIHDISQNGVRLESSNFDHSLDEKLDLVLRNPHNKMSVSKEGEIVWKRDGWYGCAMGIKLKDEDHNTDIRISELISSIENSPAEQSMAYEKPGQSPEQKNPALTVLSSAYRTIPETIRDTVVSLSAKKKLLQANTTVTKPLHKTADLNINLGLSAKSQAKRLDGKNFLLITLISVISLLSIAANMYLLNSNTTKETVEAVMVPVIIRDIPEKPPVTIIMPDKIMKLEKVAPVADMKRVITFDFGIDDVGGVHFSKIGDVVTALHKHPGSIVEVEGHADNLGSTIYNLDLSMQRALAVKKILTQKGIDTERIKLAYFGDTIPIGSNSTESGRRNNRRVEMRIVSDIH